METAKKNVLNATKNPVEVIPAGYWQAAESTDDYSFCSCCVGPGFDFDDFELMKDHQQLCDDLQRQHPELTHLV